MALTNQNWGAMVVVAVLSLIPCAASPTALNVQNPTGLPVYPNLDNARLEDRFRTDDFGRWCIRLSARSADSLETVENWYRRALATASETDLRNDGNYASSYGDLDGIKLGVNLSFVAVYKATRGSATSIDMVRCSPVLH